MDFIAVAETLEAQAAALRRHAAALANEGQATLELEPTDEWIEGWAGGEQPPETYGKNVDLRFRSGYLEVGVPAHAWQWGHVNKDTNSDIVAYRISAEQPPA